MAAGNLDDGPRSGDTCSGGSEGRKLPWEGRTQFPLGRNDPDGRAAGTFGQGDWRRKSVLHERTTNNLSIPTSGDTGTRETHPTGVGNRLGATRGRPF